MQSLMLTLSSTMYFNELYLWEKNDACKINDVTDHSTTYCYTSKHDHGNLPLLKCSGSNADVVSSLQEAKSLCDIYLTECIGELMKNSSNDQAPDYKKPRIENEDEMGI